MRVGVTLLLATLATAGCYNPDIKNGGFACAEAGQLCPDGFTCDMTDYHCWKNGTHPTDGPSMCTTVPAVAPLCQATLLSAGCDPVCQVNCNCGRCNVSSSGDTVCTTFGTKTLGQVCTFGANDDCAPGYICLQEACGNLLGRCYRHCTDSSQCTGTICQNPINTATGAPSGHLTCSVAPQACDPVNNTGCPNGALNCYMSAPQTFCDCPHYLDPAQQLALGAPCQNSNDCAPGLVCITSGGSTRSKAGATRQPKRA